MLEFASRLLTNRVAERANEYSSKTKFLVHSTDNTRADITVKGQKVEEIIKAFNYLGSIITRDAAR